MKIKDSFYALVIFVVLVMLCLPVLRLGVANDRIHVMEDGKPKQYDVVETKQYQLVEVESLKDTATQLPTIMEEAIRDAKTDAAAHLNKMMWFSAGFFFPGVGILVSQWYQPFLPTGRVLGKSPEYIAFYFDAYKVETKKLQFRWSFIGCLVGSATVSGIISIFD